MIQANELRLGNWVNFNDGSSHDDYRQISGVSNSGVQVTVKGCIHAKAVRSLKIAYAIPLTDTILEKLPQFKKVPYLGEDGHYFEFDLECGLCLLSGDNNDVLVCDLDNIRFEYLHQLQNFLASLGKELEINL